MQLQQGHTSQSVHEHTTCCNRSFAITVFCEVHPASLFTDLPFRLGRPASYDLWQRRCFAISRAIFSWQSFTILTGVVIKANRLEWAPSLFVMSHPAHFLECYLFVSDYLRSQAGFQLEVVLELAKIIAPTIESHTLQPSRNGLG